MQQPDVKGAGVRGPSRIRSEHPRRWPAGSSCTLVLAVVHTFTPPSPRHAFNPVFRKPTGCALSIHCQKTDIETSSNNIDFQKIVKNYQSCIELENALVQNTDAFHLSILI